MIPGEVFYCERDIILNDNRRTIKIKVINSGDRPVQVGSHFHFFEVNKLLTFSGLSDWIIEKLKKNNDNNIESNLDRLIRSWIMRYIKMKE